MLIIGAVYFGLAYGLDSLVDNHGVEVAAYIVAGALTAWNGFVLGIGVAAVAVD